MKTINVAQMEQVKGGNLYGCWPKAWIISTLDGKGEEKKEVKKK